MKNWITTLGLVITLHTIAYGQQQKEEIDVADSLNFMLGTWKGEGWVKKGPVAQTFQLTEIISSKVNGAVLSIDGAGVAIDTSTNETKKVHDAFGVIYYDEKTQGFRIMAFSSAAAQKDVAFIREGKTITWGFKVDNGGEVRFTENFSEEGRWTTVGEYSGGGNKWFTFLKYDLERQ